MMAMIFNFLVAPTEENVTLLTGDEMKAILAENEALVQAMRKTRADLAHAYGLEIMEPVESASPSFAQARAREEAKTGTSFRKFFTN